MQPSLAKTAVESGLGHGRWPEDGCGFRGWSQGRRRLLIGPVAVHCAQVLQEYLEACPDMEPSRAMDVKARLLNLPVESEAAQVGRACRARARHL